MTAEEAVDVILMALSAHEHRLDTLEGVRSTVIAALRGTPACDRIRTMLHYSGLNQKQLARRLGLHEMRVGRLVGGISVPKLAEATQIARAFGLTLDEMWGDLPEVAEKRRIA